MEEDYEYIYEDEDAGYGEDIEEVNFDHHQDYRKDFFDYDED